MEKCERNQQTVQSDFGNAGFVLNIPKSKLFPQQIGGLLGFIIDLVNGCFRIPYEKIEKLKRAIRFSGNPGKVQARTLASIIGQVINPGRACTARLR